MSLQMIPWLIQILWLQRLSWLKSMGQKPYKNLCVWGKSLVGKIDADSADEGKQCIASIHV